jgi:peptidyl-tRNA hydrolase, PTH2 family
MEPKQVIVIRKDLHMRSGKAISQGCHASMKVILDFGKYETRNVYCSNNDYDHPTKITSFSVDLNDVLKAWLNGKFTKIVVSVDSEAELLELQKKAQEAGILNALITDCGLTEFHNVPTNTCLAIGPDWPDKINEITGHLKLL